jgi:hypothetical protein
MMWQEDLFCLGRCYIGVEDSQQHEHHEGPGELREDVRRRRVNDRALQDRADQPARAMEDARAGRVRHAAVGRVVQPPATTR